MVAKLYRLASILIALSLVLSGFSAAQAAPAPADTPQFVFENRVLSISTGMMDIKFENGAITYIKDAASGEILVNGSSTKNRPSVTQGFIGFSSKDPGGSYYLRWPTEASTVTFSLLQPGAGRLTYTVYFNGSLASASKLTYDITVAASGEVLIQLTGVEGSSGLLPFSIDLPIMNSATQSVILGSGAEYFRSDAAKEDQVSFPGYGLYSPTMAVIKGGKSVVGVWSESTRYAPDNINLIHTPSYDHVVLHAEQDMATTSKQQIVSPSWRIGTYPAWYEAARRWKSAFESRTGAKPLWQNATPWVRNIHAVFEAANNDFSEKPQKFAELASITSPQKTLYYEWNGDRIVLFGDHTLVRNSDRPTAQEMQYVRQYGWPMILYHPYTLIYNEQGASRRLSMLSSMGWLPQGYQFNPDYAGTPGNWQTYWSDSRGTYDSDLHLLHPASDQFKAYLPKNLSAYLNQYGAVGAYMDTLGMDAGDWFPANKQVFNGDSFVLGEMKVIAQTRAAHPGLAIMSEYSAPWLLPHIFFTYEGVETFLRQNQYAKTRLNHPLKVALVGSYRWAKEDNTEAIDDNVSALIGTLPQVSLVGDWDVLKDRALWSQARAKLFTENDLFNDIPPVWKDGALAYYRSKSGNWFAYKKIGAIYGYVEIMPDGSEVVRLTKDNIPSATATPLPASATPTATRTFTAMPTVTLTKTETPVATSTGTSLPASATPTVASIKTESPRISPTPTWTFTATPTTSPASPTATPTSTVIVSSPTPVLTDTSTVQPATATASYTPVATIPVESPTPTETYTPTLTLPPASPTFTPTETPTPVPGPATETHTPTATNLPQETPPPATATSTATPEAQPTTDVSRIKFDDNDPAFVYSSGWVRVDDKKAYGDSYSKTSRQNASVTFTFTGQTFFVIYTAGKNYGNMDVYLDGAKVGTIRQHAGKTRYQETWKYKGRLGPGQHELRLVFTGPKNSQATLDGVTVVQPGQ
jgi:hypothetical protein